MDFVKNLEATHIVGAWGEGLCYLFHYDVTTEKMEPCNYD